MGQIIAIVAAVALIAGAIIYSTSGSPDPVVVERARAAKATVAALDAKAASEAANQQAKELVARAAAVAKAAGQ